LWLALSLWRLDTFAQVSRLLDCQACLVRQALPYELQFLALVLALHLWSARWGSVLARGAARLLLVLTLLLGLVDAFVTRQFLVRLQLHELLKFLDETEAAFDFLRVLGGAGGRAALLALTAVLGLAIVLRYLQRARHTGPAADAAVQGWRRHWTWGLPLLVGLSLAPLQERNVHSPYLRNAVQVFFEAQSRFVPYAPATPPTPAVPWGQRCVPGQGLRSDVILLVVESLSADQSRAWGGVHDWWPELDRLHSRGVAHTAHLANGFTTEDGLVALLTGQPPIPRPDRRELFKQFADVQHTVPRMLAQQGYQTAFLTSGDLGFLDKGEWLRGIGFEQLQGHDHPDYAGLPRFHFQAPPDEALYRRALGWMDSAARGQRKPYFLTLETVSTHQPYTDPRSGERSMEGAFRYADAALGDFVRALEQRRFFEHGLLIITGDHRAMVPVAAPSLRQGTQAYNHIPLLLIGQGAPPAVVQAAHSQTDLLPTLQRRVGQAPVCLTPAQGLLLPGPGAAPPECVPMRRAYDADQVFVRCGRAEHVIELEAERTRYVSKPAGPALWLAWVQRLRRGQED
jgi:arylsulfatase A-like enzyme